MFEYLANIFKKKSKENSDVIKESEPSEEVHIEPILPIGPPLLELPDSTDSPAPKPDHLIIKHRIEPTPAPPAPQAKKRPSMCPRCSLQVNSVDKECRLCHYIL